jgi:hypothetical protein
MNGLIAPKRFQRWSCSQVGFIQVKILLVISNRQEKNKTAVSCSENKAFCKQKGK